MAITEEKEPAPELATLVLSVPPERIGELKALAAYKTAVARANADDDESKKQSLCRRRTGVKKKRSGPAYGSS
jgi:hypothetical protein